MNKGRVYPFPNDTYNSPRTWKVMQESATLDDAGRKPFESILKLKLGKKIVTKAFLLQMLQTVVQKKLVILKTDQNVLGEPLVQHDVNVNTAN